MEAFRTVALIILVLFVAYNLITLRGAGQTAEVTAPQLNARSGPGPDYGVVFQLDRGEEVRLGSWEGRWAYIERSKRVEAFVQRGWVYAEHLSVEPDSRANLFLKRSDVALMQHNAHKSVMVVGFIYVAIAIIGGMAGLTARQAYSAAVWVPGILGGVATFGIFAATTNPFVPLGVCMVCAGYSIVLPFFLRAFGYSFNFYRAFEGMYKTVLVYVFTIFPLHILDAFVDVRGFLSGGG
jgi:uncharacterized protein YraI